MTMPLPDSRLAHAIVDDVHRDYELVTGGMDAEADARPMEPIPVHDPLGATVAADGVYKTVVVSTGINPVVEAFPRDPSRLGGRIVTIDQPVILCSSRELAQQAANSTASAAASPASAAAYAQSNAPGALAQVVTTAALPAGLYSVTVNANLAGTTTGADANNMQLLANGVVVTTLFVNSTSGAAAEAQTFQLQSAGGAFSVQAIAAGGASSVYRAQITATLVSGSAPSGVLYPAGFYLPVSLNFVVSNQDQCWIAATSATPTRVSVLIERK